MILLLAAAVLAQALPALAQDSGGQLWVQSFEDRNGSGARDSGEPFLTTGVSVDLLNAEGVVMASGTLEGAPFASQGFIGFRFLDPGMYMVVISSPDLTATTPEQVEVTITESSLPVTVFYGAQRAASETSSENDSGAESLLSRPLARVALAGFGAAVVVGIMVVIGVIIYTLVLRRRYQAELKRLAVTTGSMRAVRVNETGEVYQTGTSRAYSGYVSAEEEDEEV